MKKLIFNIVALLLLGSSVAVAVDIFPPGPGLRFFEQAGNGSNYKAFAPPAAITSNTTCTFENDSNFIPDSCVGNGVDDTGALADSDYGDITVSGVGTVWTVDPDAVALGTDTTGNYVATVADGTGIDGTCSAEGCTYTPTLDLTEITAAVLGNGTTSTLQLGTIELGAATDTTISRPGAGDIAVEGNTVVRAGSAAGGDLTGTYPSPTVAANAVALGTDTTGGYAASASEGGPATTVADTDFGDISITAGVWSVDPNSVALSTDTTGNYAAGDAEAGAALTGDSATAFFSSGTIEDARIDGSAEVDEVLNSDLGDFTCVAGSCAIDANAVALTTDTTGNYMADIAAGTGIATTHTPAEGSTGTIALDYSDAGADPALAADTCRFTGDATVNGEIVCEGDTANVFETRIVVTDPTADRAMTIPNADSNPVQPLTCGGTDKVSAISSAGAITCTTDTGGSATPGGSDTQVQFNDSSAFGGDAGFLYNKTTDTATLLGNLELGAATDTTIARTGAGAVSVEGVGVALNSTSLPHTASQFEIGAASDTTLARSAAGVATIEGKIIRTTGKRSLFVSAGALIPQTTNGCLPETVEAASAQPMYKTCAYDPATGEFAQFYVAMPKGTDESTTVTLTTYWTGATATDGTDDVIWDTTCQGRSDNDALANAYPAVTSVTDTLQTVNSLMIGAESGAMTVGSSWAEGDILWCRVSRNAASGSDTYNGDARLLGVKLIFSINAASDD